MSFILHGVNEQSCSLDSKFLLELRLIVYHKLLRHGLFCYFSRAKWLGYEAALLACRSVMTAQRGVETSGLFVLFSCCVMFRLSEYCDVLRLWMKQAWTRDSPICAATQVQAGWLMNRGSIPVSRKKLLSFRKRPDRFTTQIKRQRRPENVSSISSCARLKVHGCHTHTHTHAHTHTIIFPYVPYLNGVESN